MRVNISSLLRFKELRGWFRGSSEFNIVVNEKAFSIISFKGGLTHVTTIPADIDSDIPLPFGFSFFSSLFLNLTSKNKELDELRIVLSQSNVAISLNERVINVHFNLYNSGNMSKLRTNSQPIKLVTDEFNWLLNTSKFYRDENIQIKDNLIFMETQDGIFYSKLETPISKSFSFVPELLLKTKNTAELFLSSSLEVRTPSFATFSNLYKISNAAYETLIYARTHKAHIKVTLNLHNHKLDIKRLRAADFVTSFDDKLLNIATKNNEHLSLPYTALETDIVTKDFSKYTKMSEILSSIKLEGYAIHQLIANEKSVNLFVTPYANIIRFNKNSFLLLRSFL